MTRDETREALAAAMLEGTGFLRGNRFDALVLADLCLPVAAKAWDDGYHAGIDDEENCEHRFGRTSRILWRLSCRRFIAPWDRGKCSLYESPNPFRGEE